MSTLAVTLIKATTEKIGVPRSIYLRFPLGHIFGIPGDTATQRKLLREMLDLWPTITFPGTIHELPYRWKDIRRQTAHL